HLAREADADGPRRHPEEGGRDRGLQGDAGLPEMREGDPAQARQAADGRARPSLPQMRRGYPVTKEQKSESHAAPRLKAHYHEKVVPSLMESLGAENPFEVPRLVKVVINIGVNEAKENIQA